MKLFWSQTCWVEYKPLYMLSKLFWCKRISLKIGTQYSQLSSFTCSTSGLLRKWLDVHFHIVCHLETNVWTKVDESLIELRSHKFTLWNASNCLLAVYKVEATVSVLRADFSFAQKPGQLDGFFISTDLKGLRESKELWRCRNGVSVYCSLYELGKSMLKWTGACSFFY